jgi:hypothetical protein
VEQVIIYLIKRGITQVVPKYASGVLVEGK